MQHLSRLLPVLIGCEESQVICSEFRAFGFEAYSCDLQPTRGNAAWHYQMDILELIPSRRWGLIILHPDCTKMALSGNRWYGKGSSKHHERLAALDWTKALWELAKQYSDRVALENPASVIFPVLNAPVCYVQPYEHGHGETKKTGFALHGLPKLLPTNPVPGRDARVWKMPPSPTRKRDRSRSFTGIARAIVQQWSPFISHDAPRNSV